MLGLRTEAEQARASVSSLEAKIKDLEDKVANLAVEKAALVTDSANWRNRSDQLIEKSFKVNPDELRRLQAGLRRIPVDSPELLVGSEIFPPDPGSYPALVNFFFKVYRAKFF